MLANPIGEGMPRQPSRAATLRSRGPRCDTPTPSEPQRRPDRQGLSSSLRRRSPASRPSPPGGLRPALTPATPTTRARTQAPPPPNLQVNPTTSLTRPHSFRDADLQYVVKRQRSALRGRLEPNL
jgi:hypothetical protein